jgi:hypothetical protein
VKQVEGGADAGVEVAVGEGFFESGEGGLAGAVAGGEILDFVGAVEGDDQFVDVGIAGDERTAIVVDLIDVSRCSDQATIPPLRSPRALCARRKKRAAPVGMTI